MSPPLARAFATLILVAAAPGGAVAQSSLNPRVNSLQVRKNFDVTGPLGASGIVTIDGTKVPVLPLYNVPTDNHIVMSPGGARVSVKSLGGHDTYGKYGPDSIRAQATFRATSEADAGIEETTMLIEHRGVTGYSPPWYPNSAYPAGTQITGGNGYIFETLSACTTATAKPTATKPAGPNPPQTDGTCTWRYVGIGAGNNKTPMLIYGSIEPPRAGLPGGGQGWAEALIMDVQVGAWPRGGGFAVGQEIDVGNGKGECPPAIQNGCQIYGSFINGNGLYRSTVGTFYGGDKGFHVGILLSGTAASSIGIANGSNAETGYYDNGQHAIASWLDRATTPYAIRLEGTYSGGQAIGTGWSIDPVGKVTSAALNTPLSTPASSSAPCTAGDWAHDTAYVYTCVAANTWKRAALSAW